MSDSRAPANFAILAFPESAVSGIYGMYDVFMSAGRDWEIIAEGKPGRPLISPVVVSAQAGTFTAANGVRITPDATLENALLPSVICVPELLVAPGEPLQ